MTDSPNTRDDADERPETPEDTPDKDTDRSASQAAPEADDAAASPSSDTPAETTADAAATTSPADASAEAKRDAAADDDAPTPPATDEDAEDEDVVFADPAPRQFPLFAVIGAVVLLVVVGVGLGVWLTRPPGEPDSTEVIARVGETEITRGEFLSNYTPGQDPQALLDQLIDIELVVREARNEGTEIDEEAVDQQVEQLRAQHADQEAFDAFLAEANIGSEEQLRDILARQQLVEAMVQSHTEIEQARSRHILLQAEGEDAVADRQEEAEDLLDQIEDGADFAELARENSDDPGSAVEGGDLGWMPRGVLVPEFEEAIFSMEPGDVQLVETQYGWHIIELQEEAQVRELDNPALLQTPAGQQALNESFLPWVESLRSEADANNEIEVLVEPTELALPEPTLAPMPTAQP